MTEAVPSDAAAARSDVLLAAELAEATGRMLIRLRRHRMASGSAMTGASDRLAELADRRAHTFLAGELARLRPRDAVLSEEALPPPDRGTAPRLWIIDPLDGTSDFAAGRPDFAVHVALVEGGRVTAAAVAVPAENQVLATNRVALAPTGARQNAPLAVSRSRMPVFAPVVASALGIEVEALGSAGYKTARVVAGHARAYVHAGGIREWDVAAPAGVAVAAGLAVTDLDGRPIVFNQPDLTLARGLVICRREDLPVILRAVATVTLPP